jgi:heme O synthase-like polyprenyltransferase
MSSLLSTMMIAASGAVGYLYSIISFVIWLLVMVWIYNIAKRKGRHAVGWVILGFFFSIIALIIILLMPSKRATQSY